MLKPFTPSSPTVTLRATGSTSKIALGTGGRNYGQQVLVETPAGSPVAYIKFGDSTVTTTTTGMAILPNQPMIFSIGIGNTSYISGITGSSSATILATLGQGQ